MRAGSSNGRAAVLQTAGCRFESCPVHAQTHDVQEVARHHASDDRVGPVTGVAPAGCTTGASCFCSSVVRASACRAEGRRFDPGQKRGGWPGEPLPLGMGGQLPAGVAAWRPDRRVQDPMSRSSGPRVDPPWCNGSTPESDSGSWVRILTEERVMDPAGDGHRRPGDNTTV